MIDGCSSRGLRAHQDLPAVGQLEEDRKAVGPSEVMPENR